MAWLVRKVSRAKWEPTLGTKKISADAVTGDLRTSNNELSLWKIASSERAELEKAALALAAAGDRIDTLDIAWIASEDIEGQGISLRDSPGRTAAVALKHSHVDAEKLDLTALCTIAEILARAIRDRAHFKRFTKAQVKQLLRTSLDAGQVDRALLSVKLLCDLTK